MDRTFDSDHGKLNTDLIAEKCTGCALCVDICASEALELVQGHPEKVRPDDCLYCGLCEDTCPSGALGQTQFPVIDWSCCTDCTLCVDICNLAVFEVQNEEVVIAGPQECNGCEDCIEVCPVGAIGLAREGGKEEWIRPRPGSTKR